MTSAILVANPHAGGGRARTVALKAAETLRDSGIDIELFLPETLPAMQSQLNQIDEGSASTLIACGGDGTVNQVLQAAMRTQSALAIIPAGTGNDIARCLGITRAEFDPWLQSLGSLLKSSTFTRVDVTKIIHADKSRWCLGVMSAGFDSAVNERADELTRLRGTVRYITALILELKQFTLHDFQLTVDEQRESGTALLIAVGNSSSYGGGMRICPTADMEDGLLDVTWVSAAPRRTVLRVFPRIFSGTHVRHPLVRTFVGHRIRIEANGAMIYADGERVGQTPVSVEVVPRGLRIVRPIKE